MKIIIEGVDGTGKTTLANKLSKFTGFPIKHRSKPESEEEKKLMYKSYVESITSGTDEIWDRCWYSEMVYGPIMRDQTYIGFSEMYHLEKLLIQNGGGIIIYCTDSLPLIWRRLKKRGENYITSFFKLYQLHSSYKFIMEHNVHLLPVVKYELSKNLYKL